MAKTAGEIAGYDPLADTDDEIEVIEVTVVPSDIEQTRAEMAETIEALKEKLSPETLMQQAKDTVREATIGKAHDAASSAYESARNAVGGAVDSAQQVVGTARDTVQGTATMFADTIKQNPVPIALTTLGIGWLLMSARKKGSGNSELWRSSSYDYGTGVMEPAPPQSRAGEILAQAQSRAAEVAGRAQDKAQAVAGRVQDHISQLSEQAQDQAQKTVSTFQQVLQQNPLALGAAAVTLGMALGLLVPETQQENRLMGQTRDRLAEKAQETAHEVAQKVESVAHEALESAKDAARDQGLTA